MENSYIKNSEKPLDNLGIMKKIQRKIQKTKESVKKMFNYSSDKKRSSNILNLNYSEDDREKICDKNEEFEAEELRLSKKKVSIYLNNKKIDCEESLVIGKEVPEISIFKVENEQDKEMPSFDHINDEGLDQHKKNDLEKNCTHNHHLKLQFANFADLYYPSNSNHSIGRIMDSLKKDTVLEENKQNNNIIEIKETKKEKESNHEENASSKKKKVGFIKSLSIKPDQIKLLPKIAVFEEEGKFNLGYYNTDSI